MANLSFRERYDSIVSSMLELRNEMKDDTSENEVRQLRSQLADMQSKGEELQSALEKSQQNLRQAVGDVAYFKVLLDESGKAAPKRDWQSLRKVALEEQVEAARAEAGRWRQLAEQRGEELAELRAQLQPVSKDPSTLRAIQAPDGQSPQVKVRVPKKMGKAGSTQYFDIFSPQDQGGEKTEKPQPGPDRRGSPRPRRLQMARRPSSATTESRTESPATRGKVQSARNPLSASMVAR